MVEATQNSDTSNSNAVAKAVAAIFSFLAFAANGLQMSMFQSSYMSDCIMFVAWKVWFPCCQGHVTVEPYSAQSLKKRKGVLGIVVSYMFYFCWVTLLVRLSYFSSCYLWLVNLLERLHSLVWWLLPWSFALLDTSSTAQGGGWSFKNRKPIGEVGCCESGIAERSHWWSERWLISLTISLSFSDYLPTYLPTYLSISLSLSFI